MGGHWMHLICFQNCEAPVLPLRLAGSSVCEKVSSTIAGYAYNHDDDECVSKYSPFLVQPQSVGSLSTATTV
jgi:hypothetical protein